MGKPEETVHDLRGPMRELREYARGALDVAHHDISPVAGLIEDEEVLDLLLFAEAEYEPVGDMPPTFWETKFAEQIVQRQATVKASRAIDEGNQAVSAFLTGIPSYKRDVSGMDGVDDIEDWLLHSEQCKLVYLAALMGRGKTSFAIKCVQIIERHYRRAAKVADELNGLDPAAIPVPEIATNFYVDVPEEARIDWVQINEYDRLVEWMENGSTDDIRWMWFDEASTELTAQDGENAQRVARLILGLIKKMRKNGVNMGMIGHDKGDVHKGARVMADFVDKEGLKEATIYEGIKDRQPVNELFSVRGIPDVTAWGWNTEDMADWDWCDEEEELEETVEGITEDELREYRDERIANLYHNVDSVGYEDLQESFGVSAGTVRNAIKRFEDDHAAVEKAVAD